MQYILEGQDHLFLQSLVKLTLKMSGPAVGFLWVDFLFWIFFFTGFVVYRFCFLLESMLLNYIFLGNCPFCMCFQIYWHEILHKIVF